jgi:hypothetical protein
MEPHVKTEALDTAVPVACLQSSPGVTAYRTSSLVANADAAKTLWPLYHATEDCL